MKTGVARRLGAAFHPPRFGLGSPRCIVAFKKTIWLIDLSSGPNQAQAGKAFEQNRQSENGEED